MLHRINGVPVDKDLVRSGQAMEVLAIPDAGVVRDRVVIQKLLALHEHHCDFGALLPAVRAVREQVDWKEVRKRTADNDFAVAFLLLADRLGITG